MSTIKSGDRSICILCNGLVRFNGCWKHDNSSDNDHEVIPWTDDMCDHIVGKEYENLYYLSKLLVPGKLEWMIENDWMDLWFNYCPDCGASLLSLFKKQREHLTNSETEV